MKKGKMRERRRNNEGQQRRINEGKKRNNDGLLRPFTLCLYGYFCFLKLISKLKSLAKLANFTKMKRTVKGNCCAVKRKDLQLHKSDGSVSSTGNATENSSWSLPPVDCCPLTIIHSQCFSPKLSFLVIIVFGKFPLVANVITESSA